MKNLFKDLPVEANFKTNCYEVGFHQKTSEKTAISNTGHIVNILPNSEIIPVGLVKMKKENGVFNQDTSKPLNYAETENKYFVLAMKPESKKYAVSLITVEKNFCYDSVTALEVQEKAESTGEFEKVKIFNCDQFRESKETPLGQENAVIMPSIDEIKKRIAGYMQPLEFSKPFVVVNKNGRLWNMFATQIEAKNCLDQRNSPEQKYPSDLKDQPYRVVTWAEHDALEKAENVTAPVQISSERYYDLLECLPPKNWHTDSNGYNVFFMSEFNTATYTNQVIKNGDKYYTKGVDYCDKTTWCKPSDLETVTLCEAP